MDVIDSIYFSATSPESSSLCIPLGRVVDIYWEPSSAVFPFTLLYLSFTIIIAALVSLVVPFFFVLVLMYLGVGFRILVCFG